MNQYPQSCGASGPMVVDQTPDSSFVILRSVPLSQLPLSVTSVAFGAASRNVTERSGLISGDFNGAGRAAACGAAPGAGAWRAASGITAVETMSAAAAVSVIRMVDSIVIAVDKPDSVSFRRTPRFP